MRITIELWEADEYVVCVNGKITGGTIHRSDAIFLRRWLESDTFAAIRKAILAEGEKEKTI